MILFKPTFWTSNWLCVFCSRQTFIKCFLFLLFILPVYYLVYQTIKYTHHYLILIGAYCFTNQTPFGYIENKHINDSFYIQQCSFNNIDACQRIDNQTLLFRLESNTGFASEFNNLIRAFIYAINTHRRFLINDKYWNYGSFSSFFNITQDRFSPWLPSSLYCSQRIFLPFIHNKSNRIYIPQHFTIGRDTDGGFSTLNLIMKPFEGNNQTLKIKRIVAQYIWKTINDETRYFINQYLNDLQINTITYAIHVRRGDKLNEEANQISTEKYIDGIEYFISKQRKNVDLKHRIFVASDDHSVIIQFRRLRPDWDFAQINSESSRLLNGHQQNIFNRLPLHTKLKLTRILLTEIEILSRVNYVVCTFSSNICRLVQILRIQEPDTVRSLDVEWYPE